MASRTVFTTEEPRYMEDCSLRRDDSNRTLHFAILCDTAFRRTLALRNEEDADHENEKPTDEALTRDMSPHNNW
eukprot:640284-Amphidinium_carterae.1